MDPETARQKIKSAIEQMDAEGQDFAVLDVFSINGGYIDPLDDAADRQGLEITYFNEVNEGKALRAAILWRNRKPDLNAMSIAVKRYQSRLP